MSDDELTREFAARAEPVLGQAASARLADAIWTLDAAEHVRRLPTSRPSRRGNE